MGTRPAHPPVTVQSCASSLVTLGNGIIGGIGASTYPAQDGDMLGAEAAYCALEAELQHYLDTYTSTHDYDEYHFDLDAIEHDPYVLISMLSALHEGEWTLEEVRGTLQTIFDRQYILTEDVVTERRYYIETDTWTDSEGNTHTSSYRVSRRGARLKGSTSGCCLSAFPHLPAGNLYA